MMFAQTPALLATGAVARDGDKSSAAASRAEGDRWSSVMSKGKGTDGFHLPGREEDRGCAKPSARQTRAPGGRG